MASASAGGATEHYGEATSVVPHILAADFQVLPVPAIHQCLLQLDLKIANDTVEGCTAVKLRVPLPLGATVCRFEEQRNGLWFPAVPAEARKAKEVLYREREAGRVAAVTSQVQGNVFEIELSNLPFNEVTHCRLWCSYAEASPLELPSFDADTLITLDGQKFEPEELRRLGVQQTENGPAACRGACFGQQHFACYVPFVGAEVDGEAARVPSCIAVVWDTSGSQHQDHSQRFARLRELSAACADRVRFDLWTFDISLRGVLRGASVEELITELGALLHDGGTDLSLLTRALAEAATANTDAVLLFSDGMDSLGGSARVPEACPPVYAVVDSITASSQFLRPLCASSGGQLLGSGCDYSQVLKPQTLLTRIETDQSDEGFCNPDDAFQCCPDHRLANLRVPIEPEGLCICGTLGCVSKITVEVTAGSLRREICFDLAAAAPVTESAAPLLGFLHARQLYAAVQRDGSAMGVDLAVVQEELALRYGFCSPEASLMMLYEPRQFLENAVKCPAAHPAHAAWKAEVSKAGEAAADVPTVSGIGQPKTAAQMEVVASLASRLRAYVQDPIPKSITTNEQPTAAESSPRPPATRLSANAEAAPVAPTLKRKKRSSSTPITSTVYEPAEDVQCFRNHGLNARAKQAYEEALEAARLELPTTHPTRLGVTLNYSVLLKELGEGERAAQLARQGFEDSIAELDNVAEDSYRDSTVVMQMLRDNLTLWASDEEAAPATQPTDAEALPGAPAAASDRPAGAGSPDAAVGDCEAYVGGQERSYLPVLEAALQQGSWLEVYSCLRQEHAQSPSFFLYSASAILGHSAEQAALACRVCTNCLEMNLEDAQMLRSVGYFLMKASSWELALPVFDRVQKLAPLEPQSFLDGALVRTFKLHRTFDEVELQEAVRLATKVITHTWADRFAEIEWPALVLLHLLVLLGESRGLRDLWPLDAGLRCPDFEVGLVVWLGWDTDKTDIDLHVIEPSLNEVFYSKPRSAIGGHLSKDFTQGYGPEVYLLKTPPPGRYVIRAKYFASHQPSALTGATSAVVWALRGKGSGARFETARLQRGKETAEVMTLVV